MKTTMDLSSGLPKVPVCKISLSYDDRYYIDFMVRTDPRITDTSRTYVRTLYRMSFRRDP